MHHCIDPRIFEIFFTNFININLNHFDYQRLIHLLKHHHHHQLAFMFTGLKLAHIVNYLDFVVNHMIHFGEYLKYLDCL